ncbi:MAG: hypothetical protein Q8R25_01250 [bacterium]|nr:hypothetical protein [bacterium]
MVTIILSKESVQKQKGLVVLPIKEYQRLLEAAISTHYLSGKAAVRLDKLVEKSLREHREGKTRRIRSLADLD